MARVDIAPIFKEGEEYSPEDYIEVAKELIEEARLKLRDPDTNEIEREMLLREIENYQETIKENELKLDNQPIEQTIQDEHEGSEETKDQQGDGLLERDPTILPPDGRRLLEQIGNEEIKSIKIVRTPLSSFSKGFLNLITLGQFDKISKQYYDKIFHLSLWINDKYNLEKNEVIAFNKKNPIEQNSEVKQVNNIPTGLTFQTLIDKTKARMESKFGVYDAETNNCQDFLMNIFQANGIGDQSDYTFIKQDTKEIFSKLPAFSKALGQASTSIAAIFNRLMFGNGQKGTGHECQCGSMYNYQLPQSKCKF